MNMYDSALLIKRKRKKILSQKVAFMLLDYAKTLSAKYENENRIELGKRKYSDEIEEKLRIKEKTEYDRIKTFINAMVRQVRCSSCLHVIENRFVVTYFCGQKTCLVCNSIRAAKFLDKYKKAIESLPFIYHMVLSIKNPGNDDLRNDKQRHR